MSSEVLQAKPRSQNIHTPRTACPRRNSADIDSQLERSGQMTVITSVMIAWSRSR